MKVKKRKENKIKWISSFEEKCYLKILDLSLKNLFDRFESVTNIFTE